MKEKPEEIFRSCGGQLRMSEAIKRGKSRYMLYALRDRGVVEQARRGVYRLVDRITLLAQWRGFDKLHLEQLRPFFPVKKILFVSGS